MKEEVNKIVQYLTEKFPEDFYVDYEEGEKNKILFVQFIMNKIDKIDNIIEFFNRINEVKLPNCNKQEFELWKTKDEEPIIQISYFLDVC